MPLQKCMVGKKSGWRWGDSGKCYASKKDAIKQGLAIGGGKLERSTIAVEIPVNIQKHDVDRQLVFGWASVAVDKTGRLLWIRTEIPFQSKNWRMLHINSV